MGTFWLLVIISLISYTEVDLCFAVEI